MKKKIEQLEQLADMSLIPVIMLMQALLVVGGVMLVAIGLLCFCRGI